MSDRTILLIGAGVLGFLLLNRRAAAAVPMVQRAPTINQMQDYWLKMAGVQLAGTGMQALARYAMNYNGGSTAARTVAAVDSSVSGYDYDAINNAAADYEARSSEEYIPRDSDGGYFSEWGG